MERGLKKVGESLHDKQRRIWKFCLVQLKNQQRKNSGLDLSSACFSNSFTTRPIKSIFFLIVFFILFYFILGGFGPPKSYNGSSIYNGGSKSDLLFHGRDSVESPQR